MESCTVSRDMSEIPLRTRRDDGTLRAIIVGIAVNVVSAAALQWLPPLLARLLP